MDEDTQRNWAKLGAHSPTASVLLSYRCR